MRVFYEVNEHLQVTDTRNNPGLVRLAVSQPALLGAAILQEYQELICAVSNA